MEVKKYLSSAKMLHTWSNCHNPNKSGFTITTMSTIRRSASTYRMRSSDSSKREDLIGSSKEGHYHNCHHQDLDSYRSYHH